MTDITNSPHQRFFHFDWSVPEDGFFLLDTSKAYCASSVFEFLAPTPFQSYRKDPPFVVTKPQDLTQARKYSPIAVDPPLFRTFADLPINQKEILGFANDYGLLLGGEPIAYLDADGKPSKGLLIGESYLFWCEEIFHLKKLVHIWEMVRRNQAGKLGRYIVWGDKTVAFEYPPLIRDEGMPYDLGKLVDLADKEEIKAQKWRVGEVVGPAKYFLQKATNKKLQECAAPYLELSSEGEFRPNVRPIHLLGALWVQFYQALSGQQRFRQCEGCGQLMNVTDNRTSKRMHERCSRRIIQATWRQNKRTKKVSTKLLPLPKSDKPKRRKNNGKKGK